MQNNYQGLIVNLTDVPPTVDDNYQLFTRPKPDLIDLVDH